MSGPPDSPVAGGLAVADGGEPVGRSRRRALLERFPVRVQRPSWLLAFAVGTLLLALSPLLRLVGVASRPLHLGYGVVATALLLGAAALGLRRRWPSRGPGTAQDWAQFHVYGGALFLGAVGLHAGWSWPSGTLDRWLISIAALVVASGLFGVFLRRTIPVLLTRSLTTEVLYERIPEHADELRRRAEEAVDGAPEAVRAYYRAELAREMAGPRARWRTFFDVAGTTSPHHANLEKLEEIVDRSGRETVRELRRLLGAKRELDAHWTLQKPLRWWLVGHVPLAWLLVVLVAVHLWSVATY